MNEMQMSDIFTCEEVKLVDRVFGPGNGKMVFGLDFRLDFRDRSGFLEESRMHFATELRRDHPERKLARSYLERELSGKRVIELGPGWVGDKRNNARFFETLGACEYTGVEPTSQPESEITPITFMPIYTKERATLHKLYSLVQQDGLSYLLTQPDDSAVIFSSCVFRDDVLLNVGLPEELAKKYVNELVRQMHRVTKNGAINIHADNTFDYTQFERAGFKVELSGKGGSPEHRKVESTEQTELQYLLGNGGLILRK